MIASNVLIGLGAPIQLSYSIVLPELVPFKYRGLTNAYALGITIPGAAFDPVIAKSIITLTHATWRWSYYINIILSSVACVLMWAFYHPPTTAMLHVGRKKRDLLKSLDLGGIVLFSAGMVLFLIGINWGGSLYPWNSAHVIATIVAGVVTLGIFVVYEAFVPAQPLVPVSLFNNRQYILFIITGCSGGMIYYSMGIMWPLIVSNLYTDNLVYQGWLSMSTSGPNTLGNVLCGVAFVYIRKVNIQLMIAVTGMTAFVGAMASTTQYSKDRSIVLAVIGTLFAGFVEGIPTIAVPFTAKPEDIGLAVGVFSAIRNATGAIAVAIYTSILSSKATSLSATYIPRAVLAAGLPE